MRLSPAERLWARTDKTGECWLWQGVTTPKGYGQMSIHCKRTYVHRLSYELAKGPIPEGLLVDHICHVRNCVNPDHLRAVSAKENLENRAGAQTNSATGVRGVYWNPRNKKWVANVGHEGWNYHVGYFTTIAEAEAAVIAKRNELHTHNDKDRKAA